MCVCVCVCVLLCVIVCESVSCLLMADRYCMMNYCEAPVNMVKKFAVPVNIKVFGLLAEQLLTFHKALAPYRWLLLY